MTKEKHILDRSIDVIDFSRVVEKSFADMFYVNEIYDFTDDMKALNNLLHLSMTSDLRSDQYLIDGDANNSVHIGNNSHISEIKSDLNIKPSKDYLEIYQSIKSEYHLDLEKNPNNTNPSLAKICDETNRPRLLFFLKEPIIIDLQCLAHSRIYAIENISQNDTTIPILWYEATKKYEELKKQAIELDEIKYKKDKNIDMRLSNGKYNSSNEIHKLACYENTYLEFCLAWRGNLIPEKRSGFVGAHQIKAKFYKPINTNDIIENLKCDFIRASIDNGNFSTQIPKDKVIDEFYIQATTRKDANDYLSQLAEIAREFRGKR